MNKSKAKKVVNDFVKLKLEGIDLLARVASSRSEFFKACRELSPYYKTFKFKGKGIKHCLIVHKHKPDQWKYPRNIIKLQVKLLDKMKEFQKKNKPVKWGEGYWAVELVPCRAK